MTANGYGVSSACQLSPELRAVLDELRAESPLRHRLSLELEEIRKLHTAKV